MEVCFLMVEKALFGVCYDRYTSAVFGKIQIFNVVLFHFWSLYYKEDGLVIVI